jgi:type IV pilus biogenesis protein CpaD/CtpE
MIGNQTINLIGKMEKILKKTAIYAAILGLLVACGGSDPAPGDGTNTPIALTTLKLSFATTGEATQEISITDNDGASGANAPVISGSPLNLKKSKTYDITAQLLNNAQNVTSQITAQGTIHQIRYTTDLGNNLNIINVDIDSNGRPIGILATATTNTNTVNGNLTVALFREVNKNVPTSGTKMIEGTIAVNIVN